MSPVLSHYSNFVFCSCKAQGRVIRVVALTENAVFAETHFFLGTGDGVSPMSGKDNSMQLEVPSIFAVSVDVCQIVEQLQFLGTIRRSMFNAVVAQMARKKMAAIH